MTEILKKEILKEIVDVIPNGIDKDITKQIMIENSEIQITCVACSSMKI